MKRWMALWVVMVLVLGLAAALAEADTVYVLVDADSCLNVRMLPSLRAEMVFVMERGEELTVREIQEDGWVKVSRAGDWGYCRIEYLSDRPPAEPALYAASVAKLRLRKVPGGDTIRKLAKGERVEVLGCITDADGVQWARVQQGFIQAGLLTKIEATAE